MPKDDTQGGHNLTKVKKVVKEQIDRIKTAKVDRELSNAEIKAAREACEAEGIPKKALAWAMQYADLAPEQREGHDFAYEIVREVLGVPISDQGDLFTPEERKEMRKQRLAEAEEELEDA